MKDLVAEICARFVSSLSNRESEILRTDPIQTATISNAPAFTVLIWGTHQGVTQPHAVVLMTVPSSSVDDSALLEFAVRRARAHKSPYVVTWNLRNAKLWRTPKPGVPATRDSIDKLKDYEDLYEISSSAQQIVTEPVKLKILAHGNDILFDLERLLKDEALELVQIDATYFVGRLLDAVQRLLPLVAASLQHRMETEASFRHELGAWAVKQAIAGSHMDTQFSDSIARQIIYRLLGKILFYQSLRRTARQLPKLDMANVDSAKVLPMLRAAFAQALKIDYHAVFEEAVPDRIQWPAQASRELAGLINDFNTRNFASLPQDVVGTVFERLIPPEERHSLGQYFTGENLCDFTVAFCIRSAGDAALDPTCGTGTFMIRSYDRLRWLGRHDHVSLLSQLWGVDVAPFPSELAVINLFRQRIEEHGNFPRIICQDFFKVSPGDRFPFPPPKMNLEDPSSIEETIPEFDAIVGNFPYVSADQIEKFEAGYLNYLRQRLIDDWFDTYPELFFYKSKPLQTEFERHIKAGDYKGRQKEQLQHRLSSYADLYVFLFFHAARFLKKGGRMGIVTSNAWLDVNYGYELQKFFFRKFKIVAVLESRCEPWFTEASVNTVVTILERCDDKALREAHLVRFVKVKKPLDDLIPGDPVLEAMNRWRKLSDLVAKIEQAGNVYFQKHPLCMVTEEDDDFRIRVLRQGEMRKELEKEGKTVKWGQYLRAPQVYFDILKNGKLCLLKDIAVPKRGGTTRINDFFHVDPEMANRFGIEDEYLLPLIKSPKETNTITVNTDDLKLRIFVCRRSIEELEELGHHGALKYIEWGEKQTYKKGEFKGLRWPEGTWVQKREPGWWSLPPTETNIGQIFITQALGTSHFHHFCPESIVPDARLYYLEPSENTDSQVLAASLNSSLCALMTEITGRVTMGDGVLESKVEDARDYLLMPDIRTFDPDISGQIVKLLEPLLKRPIGAIFDEIKNPDRQALDTAILEAIGLDPKKYLKPLYDGLCELVRERIELGQKRHTARKTKARGDKAEKKTADEVLKEILPQGHKRFPDDFLSAAAASQPKISITLPDQTLTFDHTPMFFGVYVPNGSFHHQVKNAAEGKFLIYAQQAGHTVAHLPGKQVELTRTVANYEKYLRDLRKQLYDAYYRRTLNTKTAARLTQNAFEKLKLPNIE
ncbi:MAG TPA: N-6 DNA methylase [Smithellaceae bacterium]|nr:N-6 DNA methylase [Smithellaceae bacterium]